MSLARSIANRSFRQLRAAKSTVRTQRPAQRGYASGHGSAHQGKASDLPWIIGSIAVTVPGTFLLLNSGSLDNPFSYPLPGSKHHGHHGHDEEEHEDAEEGEEKAEEGDEAESKDEEKSEGGEGEDEEGNKLSGTGNQTLSGKEGKQLSEEPEDDAELSKKAADGSTAKYGEETEVESDGESKVIHKPDAKGGAKRRIESANAQKLGEEEGGQSGDDSPAASKDETGGFDTQSGKQAGLSNTDTKHSTDPANDPDKSKKGEGAPETAKLQGTVQSDREQV